MICWECGLSGHLQRNVCSVHPSPQPPTFPGAQSNPGAVLSLVWI